MNKKKRVVADINITPFTDVVLVLLIIFMITTPMLSQHEIKINLPKVTQNTERTEDKVIEISIDKDGFIYINKEQVHKDHFITCRYGYGKKSWCIKIWVSYRYCR